MSSRERPEEWHIYYQRHWEVAYVFGRERFFKALSLIVPIGSILIFEGHQPARKLRQFLAADRCEKPMGRSGNASNKWLEQLRRPGIHLNSWHERIYFKQSFPERFAEFCYNESRSVRFDHLYCFSEGGKMIFWFHDAFTGGTLFLKRSISELRVKRFCFKLGPEYVSKGPISW